MNKLFFVLGFLISILAYFNDNIAGFLQDLGGSIWHWFSGFGFLMYPIYLAIFFIPAFFFISFVCSKIWPIDYKATFKMLLYGFIASSAVFILFAFIAISQFRFAQ